MMRDDGRLQEAKAIPILEVADRLGIEGLKPAGRERVGPCPVCGGRDRFGINLDRGVFVCRNCGGGDAIKLVELVQGLSFKEALAWLVGQTDQSLDPAEAARRAKKRLRDEERREKRANEERIKSIRAAQKVWRAACPAEGTEVTAYLRMRGMPPQLAAHPPKCLRFDPSMRYTVPSDRRGEYETIHQGPAMIAAVQAPDGTVIGAHRTWLDVKRPKGKAVIVHDGETMPAKKMLGSKKGGAIRLYTPARFETLVMGEGIETTLSAVAAGAPVATAAFWAGVDLGNMAGRRILHGEGMKYRGIPDLTDQDAFVPPPWIKRLIFIQDGDSEPKATRAKLLSGLRRAKHFNPALRIQIAHAGDGMDLNDVLMDRGDDD